MERYAIFSIRFDHDSLATRIYRDDMKTLADVLVRGKPD
jgi:hypothetical protein